MALQTRESATAEGPSIAAPNAPQFLPLWRLAWSNFLEHRMAVAGFGVILLMVTIALSAPTITRLSGIDPDEQNPLNRYLTPWSTVSLSSRQMESLMDQFIEQKPEVAKALQRELVGQGGIPVSAGGSVDTSADATGVERPEDALYGLLRLEKPAQKEILKKLSSPGKKDLKELLQGTTTLHVLGTDELGRDVFIRLVWGTRVSIGVGILVAVAAALLGLLVGAAAGYYGGWIDILLMRVTDSLLSLPQLPILIVVSAVSLSKLEELFPPLRLFVTPANESIVKLVFVVVLFSWMQVARLVRASVLSLKEREFILAAKTLGAADVHIIFRHLFPNVLAPLLVSVTLGVGSSIQAEAALSFLGLGIQQPTPSWGNMLFNALEIMQEAPVLIVVPGLLILATTISFNSLGDGLQEAIDPRALRR
ncbi:MAG: ABC transporter permease [Bdellovibrio sp.]|nr:MAG: ABC transporter permease [Bdellovibrio sp.]